MMEFQTERSGFSEDILPGSGEISAVAFGDWDLPDPAVARTAQT
jgi:hypothetical protein